MREIINHKSKIRNISWWVLASLVAIVLVETNALMGLAAAVIGGIILGILLFVK